MAEASRAEATGGGLPAAEAADHTTAPARDRLTAGKTGAEAEAADPEVTTTAPEQAEPETAAEPEGGAKPESEAEPAAETAEAAPEPEKATGDAAEEPSVAGSSEALAPDVTPSDDLSTPPATPDPVPSAAESPAESPTEPPGSGGFTPLPPALQALGVPPFRSRTDEHGNPAYPDHPDFLDPGDADISDYSDEAPEEHKTPALPAGWVLLLSVLLGLAAGTVAAVITLS